MSSAEPLPRLRSRPSRLADLVLGRDPVQRRAVRRLLYFTGAYAVLWGLLALAVRCGVAQGSTLFVVTCGVSGQIAFYAVLRSGRTLRMKDPLLCFPQALYGVAGVAMTYWLQSSGQSPPLQVLVLILVYDLHRLTQRQIALLASVAAGLLTCAALGRWFLRPETTNLPQEAFGLLMAVVAIPALAVIGRFVRGVYLRRREQEAALDATLDELRILSQRDALTGAFNRRHMMELMGEELKRHHRTGRPFCVAMLDIDAFKRINDTFGHAVGDTVLKQLTAMARDTLNPTDVMGRWGGEEFLVLLPEASAADAGQALEALRQRIRTHDWATHAAGLQVSFSGGIAQHAPASPLALTIRRADAALYRAKAGGRDRVEVDDAAPPSAPLRSPLAGRLAYQTEAGATDGERAGRPRTGAAHATAPAAREIEAAGPPGPPRARTRLQRLGDGLLGSEPRMRMSAQLCLVSSLLYACWMAAHLYSVRAGYMAAAVLPLVIGLHAVGMVAFYPLVRCGFASRFRDSGLVQVQILWGAAALMIVYPFNPTLRAAMMETLCLQLMFGLFALRPRKLVFTGAAIIAIQLLMLAGAARLRPLPFNVRDESFKVLYSCVIISLITWISVVRSRDKAKSVDRKRELDAAVAQVDERVRRDSLTGLFNRKHMQGLLDREKARHALTGQAFCVALIDLDHFKRVNDTHGHHVGDEVLLGFARIAQASLRETDTIARWGGEEFLVLLPETASEADGRVSMDRLRARIEASMPSATVPALRVTFSAGLALHEDGLGIERTLERADQALYRAKESGRNRIVTASRSLDSAACSRRGEREPESPGVPAAG